MKIRNQNFALTHTVFAISMGEEEGPNPEFALIVEATGLDMEQIEALKKGFDGFDQATD